MLAHVLGNKLPRRGSVIVDVKSPSSGILISCCSLLFVYHWFFEVLFLARMGLGSFVGLLLTEILRIFESSRISLNQSFCA